MIFMITPAKKGGACQLFARCWNWNLTNYQNWLGLEMKPIEMNICLPTNPQLLVMQCHAYHHCCCFKNFCKWPSLRCCCLQPPHFSTWVCSCLFKNSAQKRELKNRENEAARNRWIHKYLLVLLFGENPCDQHLQYHFVNKHTVSSFAS